jgi:hypothetical protein
MPEGATNAEKHEYLTQLLDMYYKGVIDFAFKHGVILIAILGWVISSETAQRFLANSSNARLLGILLAAAYTGFHGVWVFKWYQKSSRIYQYLQELSFMDQRYYEGQRIQPYMAAMFIVMHTAVIAVVIVFVDTLGLTTSP